RFGVARAACGPLSDSQRGADAGRDRNRAQPRRRQPAARLADQVGVGAVRPAALRPAGRRRGLAARAIAARSRTRDAVAGTGRRMIFGEPERLWWLLPATLLVLAVAWRRKTPY